MHVMNTVQPTAVAGNETGLTVICLCAGWCTACREFTPVFESLCRSQVHDRLLWVDIEDQPEVAGDLDITTFPTLVIAGADGALLFGGAALPQQGVVARLIEAARRAALLGDIDADLRAQYEHVIAAARQATDAA